MLAVQPIDMRSNIRIAGGLVTSNRVIDLGGGIVDGELLDKSPSALDATLLTGRAVSTDGIGDYGSVPTNAVFNIAGVTRTISFWFYEATYAAGSQYVMGVNGINGGGWLVYHESASTALGFISKQAASVTNHSAVRFPRPATGVWHFIVLTVTDGVLVSATVNGVAQTLTTAVAKTGTYGDSAAAFTIGCSTSGGTPSGFISCQLADVQFSNGPRYRLVSHPDVAAAGLNGLPLIDSSGLGLHGTFVGCDGVRNIAGALPQVAGMDWNRIETSIADGVWTNFSGGYETYSSTPTSVTASSTGGNDWAVRILSLPAGTTQVRIRGTLASKSGSATHPIIQLRDSMVLSPAAIGSVRGSAGPLNTLGAFDFTIQLSAPVNGIMFYSGTSNSFSVTDIKLSYFSPLIPATDSNPALDAYGNAIANPRKTANTINLPGDSASFNVADNAALAAVKTVCGWVYHSGANATLLDCGTPTLTVASNVLGSSGWTSPTLYVNGVAGTALAVGWNHVALTTATATDCGPIDGTVTSDRWLFYSEALSAAQILKNYNATKRSFT